MRIAIALLAMTIAVHAKTPRWQTLPLPPAMPTPTAKGLVAVGGASIYYAVFGNGTPVVLLHGGGGNGDHWANQLPALADEHRVIVIDTRGQGRSTRDKAAPTYDRFASDVIAVLDHLKIKRASIVGWSDGGETALKLAIDHAARVDKIFVLGANYDENGARSHGGEATFDGYITKCR